MDLPTIVMIATICVYNVATVRMLTVALRQIDIRNACVEKAPQAGDGVSADTSYSRVSGMIGAIVIAAFFWAIGNIVIYKAFAAPTEIAALLANLGQFFLGGAALFTPYAFNQVREAFKPPRP